MATSDIITKKDLVRFETNIKKLLKDSKKSNTLNPEYLELFDKLVDSINQLRLVVEFDHEQRLQAIEEYLQQS